MPFSKKKRLVETHNIKKDTPNKQKQQIYEVLPLPNVIDTSNKNNKNNFVEIYINYGYNQYSKDKKLTISNKISTNNLNNILILGSKSYILDKYDNILKTINNNFGLPLILYRQGNINNTTFINNLNTTTNFHPHGLNCDPFVDGASALNEFGLATNIGKKLTLKYPILNNSMCSAWHPHPMFRSSPLLYGNFVMPYIVNDWASDLLEPYFTLNNNDLPLVFSTIDLDKNGQLTSARLYSYPCINLDVNKNMLNDYPNISYTKDENYENLLKYCSSLGAWRGTFLQINGQIIDSYTPNSFCQNIDDSCSNTLFCTNTCTNRYSQILTHNIKSNLLRLRLVHAGSSFRRSYFGFIDDNNNFLDFWVIGSGGGFNIPFMTKMYSLESMNRGDIIIDLEEKSEVYLVAFDFDITLIEKVIPFQPYIKNPEPKYDVQFFNNFSFNSGCEVNENNPESLKHTIFNNDNCLTTFLELMNKLRSNDNKTDKIPYFKAVKFVRNNPPNSTFPISKIINIINNDILKIPEKYYFNYPENIVLKRNITMSSGMQFQVDSWIEDTDTPSLKFKLIENSNFENVKMIENTHITVNEIDSNNKIIKSHNIKYPPTDKPINIIELSNIINSKFRENNINLEYSYEKKIVNINGIVDIKSVLIKLENKSNTIRYQLVGNNNIMQFMGIEYKWGSSDINIDDPQKTDISLFLSTTENNELVKLTQHKHQPTMGTISLIIPSNSSHVGNPFQVMNDNIMNFTVTQDSSEKWIFYNTDDIFFDNHPFHFHLTTAFIDQSESSFINKSNIYNNSEDVLSIKAGTHIAFDVKFSNFNSSEGEIKYLGYMFHCHYMMHHDMNMMGQFFVEK